MNSIKIFISADKAQAQLVEALTVRLRELLQRITAKPIMFPWYRDALDVGENLLESLITHCRGSQDSKLQIQAPDIYVGIFDRAESAQACLYELGLFTAGLGFDPNRCLLLSSVGPGAVPEFLRASTIQFECPTNSSMQTSLLCMEEPAQSIRSRIAMLRAVSRSDSLQVITTKKLLERERPKSEGGDLTEEAEVLLNRAEPVEELPEGAAWVMANIRAGIKYRYFFHNQEMFSSVAQMLYRLATTVPDPANPRAPLVGVVASREDVLRNVRLMQRSLSVHFLPSKGPIELCIHNIVSQTAATCYLRFPWTENHLKWCEQQKAVFLAKDLTDLSVGDEDLERLFVFRSTPGFDLDHPKNEIAKRCIWESLRSHFNDPSLDSLLAEVFFQRLSEVEQRPIRLSSPSAQVTAEAKI